MWQILMLIGGGLALIGVIGAATEKKTPGDPLAKAREVKAAKAAKAKESDPPTVVDGNAPKE